MKLGVPKLCYVDKVGKAYFTTQPVTKQHGDDWDDPLDNAGTPYDDYNNKVTPTYKVFEALYDSRRFESPLDRQYDTRLSAQDINAGESPWLFYNAPRPTKDTVVIPAGTSAFEFANTLHSLGVTYAFSPELKEYLNDPTPFDGLVDGPVCPHCSAPAMPFRKLFDAKYELHTIFSCAHCSKIISIVK
jgi:hypothetical protein